MKLLSFVKKHRTLIAVLAIFLVGFLLLGSSQEQSIGYLSGTQGLEPTFNSVRWNGGWWSSTERGPAPKDRDTGQTLSVLPSSRAFGGTMVLNPDWAGKGMPSLCAETQVMTRDQDPPVVYEWTVANGQFTLPNGTTVNRAKQFQLLRYRLDWAVNVWLTGTLWEADGKWEDYPDRFLEVEANYGPAEIWVKLIPQSFCYFTDNPDQVFFAPSYIVLQEDSKWKGTDQQGIETLNDADIRAINDIIPKTSGSPLYIYYERGGVDVAPDTSDLLNYEGHVLDTQIFRNEYWVKIDLTQFRAYVTHTGWETSYKYPTAYLHFQVDLFVVGTWTVYYNTGEVPNLDPHDTVSYFSPLDQFFDGLSDWITGPFGQLWIIFIILVVVFVVFTFLNPGVWSVILSRRRGRNDE